MYRILEIEVFVNETSRLLNNFDAKQGDSGSNKVKLIFEDVFNTYNVDVKFKMEDNSEAVITGVIASGEYSEIIPDSVFTNAGNVNMQIKIYKDAYSVTDNTRFSFNVAAII